MKNANLGWLFYREYFRGYDYPEQPKDKQAKKKINERAEKFFALKDRLLYGFSLKDYAAETSYSSLPANYFVGFDLVTDYPGMLIGSGYTHDIAAVGATKMGFFFDHTTGLPTVPGSSVKGILRSAFPGRDKKATKNKEEHEQLAKGKEAYVKTVLKGIGVEAVKITDAFVANLENELFEGTLSDGEQLSMPCRFVCHDAVVVGTDGKLMGPDFITPHGKPATSEPNPIQLLKVMPGVRFRFTFQVHCPGTKEKESPSFCLTAEQTIALARQMLLDLGVGAKTNVGYGQLTDPAAPPPSMTTRTGASSSGTSSGSSSSTSVVVDLPIFKPTADKWFPANSLNPKRPPKVNAKVLKTLSKRSVEVQLLIDGLSKQGAVKCELKLFVDALPKPGQWVKVEVKSFAGKKAAAKSFLLKDNYHELIGKSK